jgi:hypothetical protein
MGQPSPSSVTLRYLDFFYSGRIYKRKDVFASGAKVLSGSGNGPHRLFEIE